jgi:hypothetical protein
MAGLRPGPQGIVVLSTDTQEDRQSGTWWIKVGTVGICYVGLLCFLGWGYLTRMKVKIRQHIEALR